MDTDNVAKQLRVLWRTDRTIAEIRLRHLLAGLGLRAFAALIAVFGLLMLELAAYLALVQVTSAVLAAAALGAGNFIIAAVLLIIASRAPAGRELELANEIHSSSMDALQLEARALQTHISNVVNHPLNNLIPLLIIPVATMLLKSLRSHGSSEGDPTSASPNDAPAA
ncbi:hypothetical protein [Bradyrhizobium sp. STM 3809]|uniref:hypothetical protein n=1 Tax=Bradyrhizobium sp. STM 3809 TaxID=551936 RepID=UPI00024086E1|nr:hypothetical protein [Bradyrhizobium sp. STM 3809]CCD98416.1 conserved hypothetical protein [Bradyrhizobium sp. STM 3809]